MKTYQFRVMVEPDEDRWIALCPALVKQGAATWGYTREEAFKNIQEVLEMVLESMIELGMTIPQAPDEMVLLPEERIAVTV
jgi:predicted RNase H-like HicB family nuclease